MKRVLVALTAALAMGATLIAGNLAPTGAQDGTVNVYAVHGVTAAALGGDSEVDVYAVPAGTALDGSSTPAITFEFGDTAGPLAVPAGPYDIAVFPAGADPTGAPALELTTPDLPGGATAVIVAHLDEAGAGATLSPFVLDASATAAGQARVQPFHTAAAPTVDVQLPDGTDLFPGLVNADTDPAAATQDPIEVPAGDYALDVATPDDSLVVPIGTFSLEAGTAYFVFAIGAVADETFTTAAIAIPVGEDAAPAPTEPAPTPDPVEAAPHFTG